MEREKEGVTVMIQYKDKVGVLYWLGPTECCN